jgi:hypothetical protein
MRYLDKKDIEFVIRGILWVTAFSIFYLVLQYWGFDMRNQAVRGARCVPKTSIFLLEACYGIYLALTLPLLLGISFINNIEIGFSQGRISIKMWIINLFKFVIVGGFLLLLLFSCWPGNSSGAFVSLLVALFVYLWFKKRVFFWVGFIPMVILTTSFVLFYDSPMGMQGSRIDMWKKVIQDSHIRPLGHGLDSFRTDDRDGSIKYFKYTFNDTTERIRKVKNQWMISTEIPKEFVEKISKGEHPLDYWDNIHNLYVQIFFEMGFPVLIISGFVLYFLFNIFKTCKRTSLSVALFCSLVALLLVNITQFPLYLARLGHIVPVILGMFIISVRE